MVTQTKSPPMPHISQFYATQILRELCETAIKKGKAQVCRDTSLLGLRDKPELFTGKNPFGTTAMCTCGCDRTYHALGMMAGFPYCYRPFEAFQGSHLADSFRGRGACGCMYEAYRKSAIHGQLLLCVWARRRRKTFQMVLRKVLPVGPVMNIVSLLG